MSDEINNWVFITPQDVWMFRDNKPFAAGQSFVARSMFPPTPQTVQGFLRTQYLESRNVDFKAYGRGEVDSAKQDIGYTPEKGQPTLGKLRIAGAFIARKTGDNLERLFRPPLDVQFKPDAPHPDGNKKVTHGTFRQFIVGDVPNYQTNLFEGWRPLIPPIIPDSDDKKWDAPTGWLTEDAFQAYLAGNIASHHTLIPNHEVYVMEERPGIALETARRTTRESHFYHAQFVRPNDNVGLLVGSSIEIFQEAHGSVMIGGESRFGDFDTRVNEPSSLHLHTNGNLRVVLLTPAYFDDGWQPNSGGDWSQWVGGGTLVSAAIGKPQHISGWDVAHNRPKPLRHYLPVGSVFFFENADWQNRPFTQTPTDESQDETYFGAMGYGQVALGTW